MNRKAVAKLLAQVKSGIIVPISDSAPKEVLVQQQLVAPEVFIPTKKYGEENFGIASHFNYRCTRFSNGSTWNHNTVCDRW